MGLGIPSYSGPSPPSRSFLVIVLSPLPFYMDRRRKTAAPKWNRPITTSLAVRNLSYHIRTAVALGALAGSLVLLSAPQGARSQPPTERADAIAVAQTSKEAPMERPEQKKTAHDLSDVFNPSNALPIGGFD